MNKLKFLIITLAIIALPSIVMAQGLIENTVSTADSAGYESSGIDIQLAELVGNVVRAFLSLLGIIFISYTIYGGYLWMTAAGNEERVSKSKKIIVQGAIGLIIVLSAAIIYNLVISIFSNNSGGSGGGLIGGS